MTESGTKTTMSTRVMERAAKTDLIPAAVNAAVHVLPLFQMMRNIFKHHNGVVHQYPDHQGTGEQGHQIQRKIESHMARMGRDQGCWNRDQDDDGVPDTMQKQRTSQLKPAGWPSRDHVLPRWQLQW